jgi:hypothetical protein
VGTEVTMLVPFQLVGMACAPPKVIVLVPCVVPKFAPEIVTAVPTTPELGLRLVILGAGTVTVKVEPLLAWPPTVTTTLPVAAPAGTGTTMLVPLQLVAAACTPAKVIVLVPCVVPKFAPVIVTAVPITPELGLKLVILGAGTVTVKAEPLLAWPPTVTTTLPVTAPVGTGTTMLVPLQLVGMACTPPKVTVLVPCVAPKFAPVIVTAVPTTPELGLRLVMLGAGVVTVKFDPLLAWPPTVTTTLPVTAPVGTGTTMLVPLQLVGMACTPPKVTVLVPCVVPKFAPVIATAVPTTPELGLKLVMLGPGLVIVKLDPLLAWPPTVTTTLPVTAPAGTGTTMLDPFQLVGAACIPPKVTVLVPCVVPKFAPVIVTAVPITPELGLRLVMLGAGVVTVKFDPLLAWPPTVTTTLPVTAPVGTDVTMLAPFQLVGMACTPPNVTVLVPCVVPKFAPLIVTAVPTTPELGLKLVMLGPGLVIVKLDPLLVWPPTVTTTLPVTAPAGTGTTTLAPLQLVGMACTPPKVTVLVPCVVPKFAPVIVTAVPITPELGLRLVMLGAGVVTVKFDPLLAWPPTVTTTLPVTAPVGTGATMLVPLQLVGMACTPPKVTVLVPCVVPKFAPEIATAVPTTPELGLKLVMLGPGLVIVKLEPLLVWPPTVTTTLPVTAPAGTDVTMLVPFQLVGTACTPPKVIVLVPCLAPKFAPLIVTAVPITPELGLKLVILGAGTVTVKAEPLLACPPTVTTTLPVTAPVGTDVTMLVPLQLVAAACIPPKVTVLVPCVAPKFAPVIVTAVPITPELGLKLVMLGAGVVTVKFDPLLACPLTVTTTLPVTAPAGTGATMLVPFQLVGMACAPPKVIVLVP